MNSPSSTSCSSSVIAEPKPVFEELSPYELMLRQFDDAVDLCPERLKNEFELGEGIVISERFVVRLFHDLPAEQSFKQKLAQEELQVCVGKNPGMYTDLPCIKAVF